MNIHKLRKDLRDVCDVIVFKRDLSTQITDYCYNTYKVPTGTIMDLISDRVPFTKVESELLFYLADGVCRITDRINLDDYFDEREIKRYKETSFGNKVSFPIIIPCIEVHKGRQWIGAVDAKFFIDLDKAGMIRYNPNKQRTMKKVLKGEEVEFKYSLKPSSVNQIAKLMEEQEYIPDALTLDIPDDLDADFIYDEERKELRIKYIDQFDITDGYHRLRAMLKNYEVDHTFNYPMEIQITKFSVARTQQFIFQADQKNKMTVSQSKSYDTMRYSNEIVNMLNERGSGCMLSGMIHRGANGSIVDYAALSDIIEYYWIKPISKQNIGRAEIIEIFQEVKLFINDFMQADLDLFKTYLDFRKLILLFWLMKDKKKSSEESTRILRICTEERLLKKISLRTIRPSLFKQLEEIYTELFGGLDEQTET